jgi:hypothetical protein
MNWLREVGAVKEFSAWIGAVRNIWWLIVAIGVVMIALWTAFQKVGPQTLLAVTLFLTGVLTGVLLARHRTGAGDYVWESAEYTYGFDAADPLQHTQVAKIRIKANRHNVQLFKNRYSWTGGGKFTITLPNGSHRLLTEMHRDLSWRYYYVLLDRPLRKGAGTTVEVRYDMYDTERSFQPLIAKDVIEPVKDLTLRVVFPDSLRPTRAVGAEMARAHSPDEEWQVLREREIDLEDATGCLTYEVPDPITGRRYQILWSWQSYPRTA